MDEPINNIELDELVKSNYRETIYKYLSHWILFTFLLVLSGSLAYLYVRYTVPTYQAYTTVLIKNNAKGSSGISETTPFEDLGAINFKNSVDNEKSIIQSRRIVGDVVDSLNLQFEYFSKGNVTGFTRREIYDKSPISIEFDNNVNFSEFSLFLNIRILSTKTFEILNSKGKRVYLCSFNSLISKYKNPFRILKNTNFSKYYLNREYDIVVLPRETAINKIKGRIKIEQVSSNSTILKIILEDNSKQKAIDVLDNLVFFYNKDAINDKNLVAQYTSDFIDSRMKAISKELEYVEDSVKRYKNKNDVIDVKYESENQINTKSKLRNNIIEAETDFKLSEMMLEHIKGNLGINSLIPNVLGLSQVQISNQVTDHNSLVLKRREELKTSTVKNPIVENLSIRIKEIKSNILASIKNLIKTKSKISFT